MGKKTEKTVVEPAKSPVTAAKAAPKVASDSGVVAKKTAAPKKVAAKTAPKTKPAAKKSAKPTFEDIQKQAYFVAERRQALGLPGDAASDWIQAEKELLAAK